MRGKKSLIIFSIIVSVLLVSMVSAGFGDWFKTTITGKASSQGSDVNVSILGTNQAIVEAVDNNTIGSVSPTEASTTTVTFYVTVYDPDGVNDINDNSITANFTNGAELRENTSCSLVGDIDTLRANFSCSIEMWYWDNSGTWNITVSANDLGNQSATINDSTSFSYQELKAMVITPTNLTWGSLTPGQANATATNDPTTINNTGNYNGTIDLTGIDLYGETYTSDQFDVANFTTDIETGAEVECTVVTSGTTLSNGTLTTVTSSIANRGNLSAGAGSGQEEFYYCIPSVPPLPTQTYSTLNSQSWIISY